MFLSVNWLRDYLQKPDVKIDAKDLADKLTMRGIQVAAIKRPSMGLEDVVVGRIEKIERHPNADRLQVTRVVISAAEDADKLQIVCGAKNIAEGDIVPVALVGARLPGDLNIKLSSIRGVESHGMICSAKELGVPDESEGILQLPKHSELGQPVARLLGGQQDDTIFELELTANRPDCLSMMGLAREIAPLLKTKLRDPKPARFRSTPHRTSSIIKIEVDDAAMCPRYVARVIDSMKVTESPDWIRQRLSAVGVRAVNNIVDITNFVMFEYGQPLHAFDLRKIQSGTLKVGSCKEAQDFTLLTGETVRLEPGDILILDGDRPVALAGIMGGLNSQVEVDTTSIVLESAAFDAKQIRRTAKRLGIQSEAAKRFEKGSDLAAVANASERAASLLRDGFNANVYHPAIDTNEFGVKEEVLSVDMREVRKSIGLKNLSSETVTDLLDQIGITCQKKSINILNVRLPTFRQDLKAGVDIIEEVARLQGYESIPQTFPLSVSAYDRQDEARTSYDFDLAAKKLLTSVGLRETICYSFTSDDVLKKYGQAFDDRVSLKNPISEEMRVMRTSLLPSLLETYLYNRNRRRSDQKLFEVGHVYWQETDTETKVGEATHVAGLISGNLVSGGWKGTSEPVDFYHIKGIVESLVKELTHVQLSYDPPKYSKLLHPTRSAVVKFGTKELGVMGELHPVIRDKVLGSPETIVVFELSLDMLRRFEKTQVKYKPLSKYPEVDFDLAFVVDRAVTSQMLQDSIQSVAGNLLSSLWLFDVYEGANMPEGKRSLAFRFSFQSPDRTLADEETTGLRELIVKTVTEKHGAQLRT